MRFLKAAVVILTATIFLLGCASRPASSEKLSDLQLLQKLLESSADIDAPSPDGKRALLLAASTGQTQVATWLIERGAILDARDDRGRTPLMAAAENGHNDVVRLLIERGADLNLQDSLGTTALILSATRGHNSVAEMLVREGANVDLQGPIGSALLYAVDRNRPRLAKWLILNGADLDLQNRLGETALMRASGRGYAPIVSLLMEKGAELNTQDRNGRTALAYAVEAGSIQIVAELLRRGADPKIGASGSTPLEVAGARKYQEIGALLDRAIQDSVRHEISSDRIRRDYSRLISTGTGFRVNASGHVVTNHHVTSKCNHVTIGSEPASAIATDAANDLSLLQGPEGAAASLQSENPRVGDTVVAIGYPLHGLLGTGLQAGSGEISGLSGLRDDSRFFQISAPVNPGNSGGPLVDRSGNIVGVVTSKLDAARMLRVTGDIPQSINFAIKASVLQAFLYQHGIEFQKSSSKTKIDTADLVDSARDYTVLIQCWE
jgi:ankyrin repeat protein